MTTDGLDDGAAGATYAPQPDRSEGTDEALRTVACARLQYMWAEETLTTSGAGFGVVSRSAGWPAQLEREQDTWSLISHLPDNCRSDTGGVFLAVLPLVGGTLLSIKSVIGQDGRGRGGNYLAQAFWDKSGQLGLTDLVHAALFGGLPVTRALTQPPRDGEGDHPFPAPQDWSALHQLLGDSRLDERLRWSWLGWFKDSITALPPDLLNRRPFITPDALRERYAKLGDDTLPQVSLNEEYAELVELSARARTFGALDRTEWWSRQGRLRTSPTQQWEHILRADLLQHAQPAVLSNSELVETAGLGVADAQRPEVAGELWGRILTGQLTLEGVDDAESSRRLEELLLAYAKDSDPQVARIAVRIASWAAPTNRVLATDTLSRVGPETLRDNDRAQVGRGLLTWAPTDVPYDWVPVALGALARSGSSKNANRAWPQFYLDRMLDEEGGRNRPAHPVVDPVLARTPDDVIAEWLHEIFRSDDRAVVRDGVAVYESVALRLLVAKLTPEQLDRVVALVGLPAVDVWFRLALNDRDPDASFDRMDRMWRTLAAQRQWPNVVTRFPRLLADDTEHRLRRSRQLTLVMAIVASVLAAVVGYLLLTR